MKHPFFLPVSVLLAALAAPAARAQTVSAAPPPTEPAVTLSPFEVKTDRDQGYVATDTLNAGRLSTNALMTPGNFEAMTRDLLNDLGVFNIDEASGWLTNARPLELGAIEGNSMNPASLGLNDSGVNVSLRGLGANPSTRNYFTSASTPKEFNVERAEAARGPNAILYGEGGPGGSLNYLTKRARSRDFATLRLRGDDRGSVSAALDVNRKLTGQLDARYNGAALDTRHFLDRVRYREFDHALALAWRPFRGTTVNVDVDYTRNTRPGITIAYADQYSQWDHQPVTGPITAAATLTARGLANWSAATTPYLTYVEGLGLIDFAGAAHTTGPGLPVFTEQRYGDALFPSRAAGQPGISALPPLPRSFNANPRNIDVTDRARDVQFSVDHVFAGGLTLQLAGQTSAYRADGGNFYFLNVYIDPLQFLPGTTRPNPNYGKPYSATNLGRRVDADRSSKSARIVAAYPWRHRGGTTTFSAFGMHQQQNSDTGYSDSAIRTPGSTLPITNAANTLHVFRYFDNLTTRLPDFSKTLDLVSVATARGITKQKTQAFEAAAAGSYFRDTLSVIAGFRRDRSALETYNGVAATRDARSGAFTEYTPDSRLAFNNTTTVGFVYFPIKMLGVYANHGEGFTIQTTTNKRLDGSFTKANIVPATERSGGLRFNLNAGETKIVGSVGYYKAEQENLPVGVGVGNVNTLWRDLGSFEGRSYSNRYIETFSGDPFSSAALNAITSSRSIVGWGWEGSVTANFGQSLRLTLNAALPRTKQGDTALDYVAYVNQNLATWTALAANPANPNRAADSTFVAQVNQFIAGFADGRSQERTYKYRYNLFGVYTVPRDTLKGLRLGGGVQFHGPSQIGNAIGQAYNYVYAKSYYLATASLGYPFKIGRRKIDVQLNVDNLLNQGDAIYNGLFAYVFNGTTYNIPYGTKNIWPRTGRLTVTIPY